MSKEYPHKTRAGATIRLIANIRSLIDDYTPGQPYLDNLVWRIKAEIADFEAEQSDAPTKVRR